MTDPSGGVTKGLLDKLLKAQERRAERERKLSFAAKLRILDKLQQERRQQEEQERGGSHSP